MRISSMKTGIAKVMIDDLSVTIIGIYC